MYIIFWPEGQLTFYGPFLIRVCQPEKVDRFWFRGRCSGRGPLETWLTLPVRSLHMTLSWVGSPVLAPSIKILKDLGIPDHLTCLLRNLYAGQEATVRTGHGTTDTFQICNGVCPDCILSPCLFNLYAEHIMWNAGLDDAQAGNKIAGRNINNFRYADDTTLTAESREELKSLLMKVKEESENLAWNLTFKKRRSRYLVPSLHGK